MTTPSSQQCYAVAGLSTVLRSGRDGISFNPMNMLFVPGGATLEQQGFVKVGVTVCD